MAEPGGAFGVFGFASSDLERFGSRLEAVFRGSGFRALGLGFSVEGFGFGFVLVGLRFWGLGFIKGFRRFRV